MEIHSDVKTIYGWGILRAHDPTSEQCIVDLDWGPSPLNKPVLYCRNTEIIARSFAPIGTAVLTKTGVGVILEFRRSDCMHVIRMWNLSCPTGCTVAYMPLSDIIKVVAGNIGWEVTTPYGLGHILQCNFDSATYTVKLQWGTLYGVKQQDIVCWRARVLPACMYLLRMAKPGLEQLRTNLKSFSSIANKLVGNMHQASEDQDWNLEMSIKNIVDTFGSGNVLDGVKLALDCQKENLTNTLLDAKSRLISMLQDADITSIHNEGRVVVENLAELSLSEVMNRNASKLAVSDVKTKIEAALTALYDVDLVAAVGGNALDSIQTDNKKSKAISMHSVFDSVSELLKSTESLDLSSSAQFHENMTQMQASLNASYGSFLHEIEVSKKSIADAVYQSNSGQKLLTGSIQLRDRVVGLVPVQFRGAGEQTTLKSYSTVISAFSKKISSKTSVRALATIRDKFVETVASSDINKALSSTGSQGVDAMLVEWYKKIFSSVQDSSLYLLAGKQLFESAVHAYTQSSTSFSSLLGCNGFNDAVEDRITSMVMTAVLLSLYLSSHANSSSSYIKESYLKLFSGDSQDLSRYASNFAASISPVHLTGLYASSNYKIRLDGQQIYAIVRFPVSSTKPAELRSNLTAFVSSTFPVPEILGTDANFDQNFAQSLAPVLELFHGVSTGQSSLTIKSAATAVKATLDSDQANQVVSSILEVGEQVVGKLESFKKMEEFQGLLNASQSDVQTSMLLSTIETVDADAALSLATDAITDSNARLRLIESFQSKVIDFLSMYIPTLSISAIGGVRDEVEYYISGLNMSGFRLNKDGIAVRMTDNITSSEIFGFRASNINAKFSGINWSFSQTFFPHLSGSGIAEAIVENATIDISFKIVRVPKGVGSILSNSSADCTSKLFSLKQKYPTLVALIDSYIVGSSSTSPSELSTSIWGESADGNIENWEPALVIAQKDISIDQLKLIVENSSISWLVNMLASVFGEIIKGYVCTQLEESLVTGSSALLGTVNSVVGDNWETVGKLLRISTESLRRANLDDLFSLAGYSGSVGGPGDAGSPVKPSKEHVLKFVEESPIGLKLDIQKAGGISMFQSGASDKLFVLGVIPDSQADRLIRKLGIDPICFDHSLVRSVNGKSLQGLSSEQSLALLRAPRPLHVGIRLSDMGFARLQAARKQSPMPMYSGLTQSKISDSPSAIAPGEPKHSRRRLAATAIMFEQGPLGLRLRESKSCGGATIVSGYARGPNNELLQAEMKGNLRAGMIMLAVGDNVVFGIPFAETMNFIKSAQRPMRILFADSPDSQVILDQYPPDLSLQCVEGNIMVMSMCRVTVQDSDLASGEPDAVESESRVRDIKPGTIIIQVNKEKVEPGTTVELIREKIVSSLPGAKVAIRDMDAFIHLIKLRDKVESLTSDVEIGWPGSS